MKKKSAAGLILVVFFAFFAQGVTACLYILSAINHETKECGYYDFGSRCPDTQLTITKIEPIDGWEFIRESYFWEEECEAQGYAWVEEDLPYKKTINYKYLFKTFLRASLLVALVGIFVLFKSIVLNKTAK